MYMLIINNFWKKNVFIQWFRMSFLSKKRIKAILLQTFDKIIN